MLKAKTNTIYTAEKIHRGTNLRGEYEMILFTVAGDHARLPIWVKNVPCGVEEGKKFTIDVIEGAGIRHIKPSERYDKWQDEFSIDAIVSPA